MKIYKYPLKRGERDIVIEMPVGSKILSVNNQYDYPVIWALVDEEIKHTEGRHIVYYLTGEKFEIDSEHIFIGTCLFDNGSFIIHVFEKVL